LKNEYENGGRMDAKDQEFLMGHILPGRQDAYYDKTKIEGIRSEFARLVLRRMPQTISETSSRGHSKNSCYWWQVFRKEEVEKMDLNVVTNENLQRTIREKLLGAMANNANRRKVVPLGEVKGLIPQGWDYVTQLSTGEAIVKLPT
jgi:hypothetical protein